MDIRKCNVSLAHKHPVCEGLSPFINRCIKGYETLDSKRKTQLKHRSKKPRTEIAHRINY